MNRYSTHFCCIHERCNGNIEILSAVHDDDVIILRAAKEKIFDFFKSRTWKAWRVKTRIIGFKPSYFQSINIGN